MTVAVVTPWHNNTHLWPNYCDAIGDRPDQMIVVDNGSDPPLEFAAIRLEENAGFCGGSNAGLHEAAADVIVFLNNDISHTADDWLDTLVEAVEPGVLAGVKLRTDAHTMVDGQIVPYLDGWCLAGMRADFLELGGWDETLEEPAYYSDNLLCLEARAAGMTLREVPQVGLRHIGNGSITAEHRARVQQASAINRSRYLERARTLLHKPSPEAVGATS